MDAPHTVQLPSLGELETLSPKELRYWYREFYGKPAPRWVRSSFLLGNLAWARQAMNEGHDPEALRASIIKRLEKNADTKKIRYQPGTRLIREWHGTVHEVVVLKDGYRWQGKEYASLTPIAEEITGTHWSGPRFFGIPGS